MSWVIFSALGIGFGAGLSLSWVLWKTRAAETVVPLPLAPQPGAVPPDVAALKEQLRQAELAYYLSTEMTQFKGGFLARTAHELRSPLNGLIGAHQLILSDLCENPAEERDFIQQAHDSAMKMVQMLDEILTVSKLDQGRIQVDQKPLQLMTLFQEVQGLTHLLAEDRNLKLRVHLPAPEIYGLTDGRWLRQVLVSLISGAIAQMPEGTITLSLHPDPTTAQIWLETTCAVDFWSEPTHLLQTVSAPLTSQELLTQRLKTIPSQSIGFTLLLNQVLMEVLQGRLEVLTLPSADSELTRIQCSIPLGSLC